MPTDAWSTASFTLVVPVEKFMSPSSSMVLSGVFASLTAAATPAFPGVSLSETHLVDVMEGMASSATEAFNNTAGGSLTLSGVVYGTYEFGILVPL